MSAFSPAPFWFPLALLAFAGMWLGIGAVLSDIARWPALAREFPAAGPRPAGPRLYNQVVGIGPIGEKGITTLVPTAGGLYLYSHPLFRFRRPPVFVPWDRIRPDGERGTLWWRSAVLDLGGVTRIAVKLRGYAVLTPYLTKAGATSAA